MLADSTTSRHRQDRESKVERRRTGRNYGLCGEPRFAAHSWVLTILRQCCSRIAPTFASPHITTLLFPLTVPSLQNLCSNDRAAEIFSNVEAFYRVGTLVASSKATEFIQTGCMSVISVGAQLLLSIPSELSAFSSIHRLTFYPHMLLSNLSRSESGVLNACGASTGSVSEGAPLLYVFSDPAVFKSI